MFRKLREGRQPEPTSLYVDQVSQFIQDGFANFSGSNTSVQNEFRLRVIKKWDELQTAVQLSNKQDFESKELNPIYLRAKLNILSSVYFEFKTKIITTTSYLQKLLVLKLNLTTEIESNPNIWGIDIFDITRNPLYRSAHKPS